MKRLRLLVPMATIAALLLLLIAPAGALAAPAQGHGGSECVQWHFVCRGQTLSGIARWYGTSVSHLAAINGIANPNRIFAGTYICVRTSAPRHEPAHHGEGQHRGHW